MSWADPTEDTLSELPSSSRRPPHPALSSTRGRSSKSLMSSAAGGGGGSRSERRLLMEAKAGVGAAIAEDRRERIMAKRRARKGVKFLYVFSKVVGVTACVYTAGLNVAFVYMRPDLALQDRLVRCYLVMFGWGGVLAELDTPFAKVNFRAMQKWWFKAPFYVFMAWLCLDVRTTAGTIWFVLQFVSFVALQGMAVIAVVLNVCLREVLERSGALGKRRQKRKSRSRRRGTTAGSSSSDKSERGPGVANDTSTGGLGVSSFRDRDRRRSRSSTLTRTPLTVNGGRELPGRGVGGLIQGGGGGYGDGNPPEMVPERSGLFSPQYSAGGHETYGATGEEGGRGTGAEGNPWGGGGGRSFGDAISGKIKSWLDGGQTEEESPGNVRRGNLGEGGGGGGDYSIASPESPAASVSTARSSRTNWWEDSDGDDDGTSSFVSMARDDASDAGSVISSYTSVSAGGRMEGSRFNHYTKGFGSTSSYSSRRGPPSVASSSSRRSASAAGGLTRSLEQRPPPLTNKQRPDMSYTGSGLGGAVVAGGGGGGHVPLTAQALARNDSPSARGLGFAGGSVHGAGEGSTHGGGSITGGGNWGGGLPGFGPRRAASSRRPPAWDRAGSLTGESPDYDVGRAASEVGGDDDRGDDSRYPRTGQTGRRTPGVQDYSPF